MLCLSDSGAESTKRSNTIGIECHDPACFATLGCWSTIYMRSLLGWLETRLAQIKLSYIKTTETTLEHKANRIVVASLAPGATALNIYCIWYTIILHHIVSYYIILYRLCYIIWCYVIYIYIGYYYYYIYIYIYIYVLGYYYIYIYIYIGYVILYYIILGYDISARAGSAEASRKIRSLE